MEASLSPFCRTFGRLPPGQLGGHRFPEPLYVAADSPPQSIPWGFANIVATAYRLNQGVSHSGFVVELASWTRYFDGKILVFFPQEADAKRFIDQIASMDLFEPQIGATLHRSFGAVLIDTIPRRILARANITARYSRYDLLRYHGSYYVYWPSIDRRSVPREILSRLRPDGSTRVVCQLP